MKQEKSGLSKQEKFELQLEDNSFRRNLAISMLPREQWTYHEMILDEHNDCDSSAYAELAEIKKHIVDFVNSENNNLFICSRQVGNGKTTWAVRLLQAYLYATRRQAVIDESPTGLYISVPELIANLKDFNTSTAKDYVERVKKYIDNAYLVVWDDLAIEEMSGYDRLQLYVFLNNRIFRKQANIFTSNVDELGWLTDLVGERIVSRSFDVSTVVKLSGWGRR